jgi:hypothetical protein
MTKFIFLRGYVGTLNVLDGQTYATASIFNPNIYWTSEEIERERIRRMQLAEDFAGQIRMSQEEYNLNRDAAAEQGERLHRDLNDNPIRLFQATRTVTVNPTLWTKVKIFGTGVKLVLIETWRVEPIGVVVMSILATLVTFIGIAKILSVW